MNDEATPGRSGSATVRPFLLAPRDWQAIALREAADVAGTPECSAKMVESKRYAALADEIELLRARVLDLEAVHEDASGAILQAVAAERERCLNEWNGLLLELRQMADDSADRGDVFAQRVVALLSRA